MKSKLFFIFILHPIFCFSQSSNIITILNRELEKEIRYQKENAANYYGEKYKVVKKFEIKDSITIATTKDNSVTDEPEKGKLIKILSLEIRKENLYKHGFYTEKREVDLSKIRTITKDINIIFETEPDAVKITRIEENGRKTTHTKSMFFLQLCYEKHKEYLAEELIAAFEKTNHKIKRGSWHD